MLDSQDIAYKINMSYQKRSRFKVCTTILDIGDDKFVFLRQCIKKMICVQHGPHLMNDAQQMEAGTNMDMQTGTITYLGGTL